MNASSDVRRLASAAMVLLMSIPLLTGCADQQAGAVDYSATDLRSGESVSVESLRGRPVVLVSWATWCRECDEELTALQAFSDSDDADGVAVVAVNLDAADVDAAIDAKIDANGLEVTLWRDRRNDFKRSFGALGVPTTILLDHEGRVAGTFPGGVDLETGEMRSTLDNLRRAS